MANGCCITLAGIVKDCATSIGGIKKAYIACSNDVTGVTITDDMVSAITASTGAFKEYQFKKETGNFITTATVSDSGSVFYSTDIVLQFLKQETAKRIEIAALAVGDLVVIIQDNNNKYWLFGSDENPVSLSAGTAETGTAWGDFNGYNITLQGVDQNMPYEVEKSAVDQLLNTAP